MAPLAPDRALVAAEVAYYAVALVASTFIAIRVNARFIFCYLMLVLLCLAQLISASLALSSGLQSFPIQTFSAFGTAAMLLVPFTNLLVALDKMLPMVPTLGRPAWSFLFALLAPVAFLALGFFALLITVAGYSEIYYPDERHKTPLHEIEDSVRAGRVLFLTAYLALAYLAMFLYLEKRNVLPQDRRFVTAAAAAMPFILVYTVYTIAVAFSHTGGMFDYHNVNVFVSAFMRFLMQAIVVVLFLGVGLVLPKAEKAQRGYAEETSAVADEHEMVGGNERVGELPVDNALVRPISPPPPSYHRREPPPPYQPSDLHDEFQSSSWARQTILEVSQAAEGLGVVAATHAPHTYGCTRP